MVGLGQNPYGLDSVLHEPSVIYYLCGVFAGLACTVPIRNPRIGGSGNATPVDTAESPTEVSVRVRNSGGEILRMSSFPASMHGRVHGRRNNPEAFIGHRDRIAPQACPFLELFQILLRWQPFRLMSTHVTDHNKVTPSRWTTRPSSSLTYHPKTSY